MLNKSAKKYLEMSVKEKLDNIHFRPIESVIRWSLSESDEHYIAKCALVRELKKGLIPSDCQAFLENDNTYYDDLHRPWEKPTIYTEARFKKEFGNMRTDILAITKYGAYAIEIAKTETLQQLEQKRKLYKLQGINFIMVRVG